MTIPGQLRSFGHQVAGHKDVMVDEQELMLFKPSVPMEKAFYEQALLHPKFRQFIPDYYGTLQPEPSADVQDGVAMIAASAKVAAATALSPLSPGRPPCDNDAMSTTTTTTTSTASNTNTVATVTASDTPVTTNSLATSSNIASMAGEYMPRKRELTEYICIQNLLNGFAKPCVMDIKLGTRLYDDTASPEKRARMIKKSQETTTWSLGLYICGIKVYHQQVPVDDPEAPAFIEYSRQWCKALTKEHIRDGLAAFFPSSLDPGFRDYLIRQFLLELREYYEIMQQMDVQLIASSLLFVYDADLDRRRAFFDGDVSNDEGSETSQSASDNEQTPLLDMRAIDFAHSQWKKDDATMAGYLLGLENLIKLFEDFGANGPSP